MDHQPGGAIGTRGRGAARKHYYGTGQSPGADWRQMMCLVVPDAHRVGF